MTYNVFGGKLNLAQSNLNQLMLTVCIVYVCRYVSCKLSVAVGMLRRRWRTWCRTCELFHLSATFCTVSDVMTAVDSYWFIVIILYAFVGD